MPEPLTLLIHPHPALRQPTAPVAAVTRQTRKLIDRLAAEMVRHGGAGLAAPQVGRAERLFVYRADGTGGVEALLNPEIAETSAERGVETEGCLSLPGQRFRVERARSVTVSGLNRAGRPVRLQAAGLLARVFQHEIDHLNGILICDHGELLPERRPNPRVAVAALAGLAALGC